MKITRTQNLVAAALSLALGAAINLPALASEQAAATAAITGSMTLVASASAAEEAPPAQPPAAQSQGLLPIPDYSGDFWSRSRLTGDWGSARSSLADMGIQIDIDWNQTVQSVVDGGRNTGIETSGSFDYVLNFDLMRMELMPGAMVKFRAESRFGESVNGLAGPIMPVNLDAFMPLSDSLDEDIAFTVTDLTYYQFFSEQFGVFLGKFDTLDGDPNEFASGRGNTQFLNSNFVFNSVGLLSVPYSTLGGGVVWMPSKNVSVLSMICNSTDASTTTGFDDIGDGWTWTVEADFQYRLGELPGGQNVGFIYAWDNDFRQVGRFVFRPGEGLAASSQDYTWAVYWSAWQYLFTEDHSDAPVNLQDGRPDRQGVGLFARAGYADDNTNPIEWALSGGVGGRGILPGRDNDHFGVGYYYTSIQSTRLSGLANIDDHGQGFEAFYNIAITPAAQLTLDVQLADAPLPDVDNSVMLGVRLFLRF